VARQARHGRDVGLDELIEHLLIEVGEVAAEANAGVVDEHIEIQPMRREKRVELGRGILLADIQRLCDDPR
jgi:hypothetical protein